MVTTAGSPRTAKTAASSRRRTLLAGAGGAALVLSLLMPAAAWADDYTVNSEAELIAAINAANANGDPSATIHMGSSFTITGTLPNSNKPITIDPQGFTLTTSATITSASAGLLINNATNVAGSQAINSGSIHGGDASAGNAGGIGVSVNNVTLVNSGTITAGTSTNYAGTIGNAAAGVSLSTTTLVNSGTIQGGDAQGGIAGAGVYSNNLSGFTSSITNTSTGIIRGGSDLTGVGPGNVGILVHGTNNATITNSGLIEGGNGAAAIAIDAATSNLKIINSGTIRAGTGGTVAIDLSTAPLTYLELRAGSNITGQVIANAGGTFAQSLVLGGDADSTFDMSTVGTAAQFRGFNRFEKLGASTWTLTGDGAGLPGTWIFTQGTLVFGKDAASASVNLITANGGVGGTLIFDQDSDISVTNVAGAISVIQNGSGKTTLDSVNSGYSGATINAGTLSITDNRSLGDPSAALTINGGTLQWTGVAGSITRTINRTGASAFDLGSNVTIAQGLGGGALTKTGTGTLILSGDNSYTGGTTILMGGLTIGSGTTGSVQGDIVNNGTTLTFARTDNYSYAGAITGTGALSKTGAGTLTLTGHSNYGGTTTIVGTSGVAGQLSVVAGGTVTSGGATSMNSGDVTLTVDGAGSAFSTASLLAAASSSRTVAVNVTNGGLLQTSGSLNVRALAIGTSSGTLHIDGAGSLADIGGTFLVGASAFNNDGTLTITGGGALHTAGASTVGFSTGNTIRAPTVSITGAGSNWTGTSTLLVTNGSFTLDQGGTASFTSATFGSAAASRVAVVTVSGAGSKLSTTSGDLVLGSGTGTGRLTLTNGGSVDVAGSLIVSGGTSTLSLTGGSSANIAGNLVLGSGTGSGEFVLTTGNTVTIGGSMILADNAGATGILSIGGAEGQAAAAAGAFTAPTLSFGSAGSHINFNHTNSDYIFGAALSGAGIVNQLAGDTNFTGNSAAWTGTTNVTGGTLRVNGTLGDATSIINVSNNGRLGGAGTIGGNVFITDGVLAPGNSPGTLTIAGNLSLTGASVLDYEFGHSDVVGGPLNDLTVVNGDLTLDGTIDVTVTPGGDFGVGVYRVISYSGSLSDNGLTVGTTPSSGIVQTQTSVFGQVNLVNYAGADVNFWDTGATGDGVVSGGTGFWQAATGNDHWTLIDGSANADYADGNFAIFMANAGTVTVDTGFGAVNASGMQFVVDGYTITGGPLGLTGAESIIRVGDGTADGAGYAATIASAMTGAGGLSKTDLGTLVLTGASSFAGDTNVRTGALRLATGGSLTNATGHIAYDAGNQAVVTVTGEDGGGTVSTWTNNGDLVAGQFGTGTLNVTDGGVVTNADGYVGASAGGVGTVTVSGIAANGDASTWTSTGYLRVGDAGTGTLNVLAGGAVHSDGISYLGYGVGGQGTATVSGVDANGVASSWSSADDLVVGERGNGTLNITGGGKVSDVGGWIGAVSGSQGVVNVSGTDGSGNASTWANSGDMTIGNDGNATLNITAGGKVTSVSGNVGNGAGSAQVLVSGAGSAWDSSARISIGLFGTGTMRIEAGGKVSSNDGIIGDAAHGEAVITGAGSRWDNVALLTVGSYSTGSLRIEDGATVTSNQGYIGAQGAGDVTVTGTGSAWLVGPYSLTVGNYAAGSLTIEAGARVRAGGGVILGGSAGGSGTLTLTGTMANRAVLETSGIGILAGTGSVSLDGALLRATANAAFFTGFTSDIALGANGLVLDSDIYNISVAPAFTGAGALIKDGPGGLVLSGDNSYTGGTTINAGILQLGNGGTTGSVVGNIVNNGDLWLYRSDDYALGNLISGSGGLTQFGTGSVTLTAANSYTGATTVTGGTLLVNGNQSAATGLTTVGAAGTLGGTGIIGGSVDMSAGGTLAAGSGGAGTLTINGGLTLGAGSQLAFDLGQAATAGGALNDLVTVGGNLVLDGTVNVTQSAGGSFGFGIYRLFNYSGSLTDNGLTVGTTPAGDEAFIQTSVANQVNLINTAGVQLTFWDGAAGPKFDGVINGGSGVWQAHVGNDNWTDPNGTINAGYADGAVAIFSGTAGTVSVSNTLGTVTTSGMQFATTGYVITGEALTLTGTQATIRVGDGTAAGAGFAATIASELTGASQLVKTDLGTLALLGDNSYTGGTRIEGGILRLGNGGATGSITGDIVDNASLVVNRSGTLTLGGAISGSGTLTKLGTGTLILSGANSYAGGTLVGGGIVQVSSDANLGDVAGTLTLQGGTLQAGAAFASDRAILLASSNSIDTQAFDLTLAGAIGDAAGNQAGNFLNKLGTGTLTLTGANSYANRTLIAGGTLAVAGAGTIGAGNLIVGAGTVFDISQADIGARVIQLNSGPAGTIALGSKVLTLGFSGSFSDWSGTIADGGIAGGTGGSVVIEAPSGAVRFFEAQSYTGGTIVNGGTLVLAGNGGLYAGGAVAVNAGATFDIAGLAGTGTTIGDLSGAGTVSLGGKTLTFGTGNDTAFSGTLSGAGGALVKAGTGIFVHTGTGSYTGGTTIAAGTLQLGNGGTTGSILGDVVNNGTLAFDRSDEVTFAGQISGTGAVTQMGSGTTILTGANSYAGTTSVSGGTLRINGDQSAATGLTQVLNGGTLGGSGIVGGSVTVADGGTIAPGNSPGTLTINGALALSAGSRLAFEFGQAGTAGGALNDLIVVGGNLTLDGTIDVAQSAGGSFGPGVYRVIDYGGTLTDNGLAIGTVPAGAETFVQTVIAGQVNLVNTAGLTLNFWDGAAGAKNDGAILGGNGIWRAGGGQNDWTEVNGAINADYAQGSFAIFQGTGGTVTVDDVGGTVTAAGMQFTVDGYTVTGDALTLTGTQAFVRVGDGGAGDAAITATIASGLSGSAQLVKELAGTLVLTGPNSYTGGTAINGGTISIANDAFLGDAAGGLSLNGGTLRTTASFASSRAVDLAGAGTFLTDGGALTLGGAITGAGTLIKDGAGSLLLTADNSYGGGTLINAGTLQLGTGGTSGSIAGDIVDNGRLVFNRSNTLGFSGLISGSGDLVQSGSGTTVLTGANSYAGTTDVNAGTLLVNGDQSAATGLTRVSLGGTLGGTGTIGGDVLVGNGGGTLAPGAGGAGTLTINGNLTLTGQAQLAYEFGAANSVGSPLNDLVDVHGNLVLDGTINVTQSAGGNFDIGLYRVANYGGTLTDNGLAIGTMPAGAELSVQTSIAGQVNLVNTGSAVLNFWDGNTGPKFDGAINGGGGVWLAAGTDNWTDMTGAVNSAFDNGAIAIFAGAVGNVTIDNSQGAVTAAGLQFAAHGNYVILGDTLTLTGPQAMIRVGDGTAAGNGYSANIQAAIAGDAQLVKTDIGRLILGGANSYTGGTAINGGVLEIASDANLGAATGGLSFDGGTLNTTADINSARAVALAGQGVLSTDAGTTLTLSGAITGTGNLAKTGTGTLVLSGTGSFTGGTQVAQGILLVNGNYAAVTGLTTVAAGATLGGTGTIGGNVTLNGTLAPGAGGAGTLAIAGNLAIGQSGTLTYEFGAANVAGGALNDLVTVGGNLTLDGTINVNQTAGGTFSAGIYRVFNYGGTLTDNGLTLGALPAGSNVAVQTSIAGEVNLVNFAGLALNFWDGAAGPKNNGVINGGSGTWQNGTGNDNWTEASGAINAPYSDGAFAVFGGTAGTVTVDNGLGQVAASGMQFATGGYTVTGGEIALAGAQAMIRVGDGSTAGAGYVATINAALSGASQLVKTDAGTLVLGGTNSYTGGTLITGGTVQIASDANLGAAVGGVTLDNGTLATTATIASARSLTLQGAGTLSTANGTTFTLSSALSGTGALTKTGTGTLELGGNSAGYTGNTRVAAGTLAVTGTLGGPVTVDAAARLEGTGTVGTVTNAGTIAPGLSGIGTLTLTGDYTSANGTLAIDAELGGDGAHADRLVVGGATAGNTLVKVTNLGGTGAPTVEGIKIVDVAGASNGMFTLDGDYLFEGAPALIAGAYGYRLYKNGVSTPTDGDWYLRSALLSPVAPPSTPLYQPGVPVYEAYGQTLATLNALGTMQERVGNRSWSAGSDGISGIWGRMEGARSRPNAVQSTSLSDVNVDSWKTELGLDQVVSTRSDGAALVLGVLGSYGEARANIASPFGNGSIKTRGYSAGATLTWFGPQGFYVDGTAQLTWFDSKLKSTVLGKLADSNKGTGQAYSVEVGKRSPISATLSVTPQIQMAYSTLGFDRFTDPNGAAVSSRLGDSLKTRWGISLDRQDERSHLYGVANLSYEWLDGTVTEVSGTPIARSNDRLWGELGLGGSVRLGGVTLYSELSANTALHDFGKSYSLKGVGGLRLAF